jgi:hypothetical protein
MKARLKVLLDEPRGSAWPSSARTVRRTVKSVNERDPCPYLPTPRRLVAHYKGTAGDESEEGAGDGRSVCSESPGLHAAYNGMDKGLQHREVELIPKPCLSPDRGLQLTLVKVKSLVIAFNHKAVNMSLLLAHTARHTN